MSETDDRIRAFIETKFKPKKGGRAFDDDTPLFSSGIVDSFGVLELIAFLEEAFAIGGHLVLGWIYAGVSPLFLPRHSTAVVGGKNPFSV